MATEELEQVDELSQEQQELAKLKEAIDVKVEDVGQLRKKVTVTVPRSTIDERLHEQFSEIKRDSVVPGFRRGHAPMRLIEKRFGGDVNSQLSSQLLSSSYLAAIEKEDLKTIGDPLVWAKSDGDSNEKQEKLVSVEEAFELIVLPTSGDLTYSCEVEIRPEFELPSLEGIAIKQPKIAIDEEKVAEYIDRLRAMRGHYEPISDQPIKEDDLVSCSLKITAEGQTILEEEDAQLAARPQRYAGVLMEELGKTLKGAKTGDKKKLIGLLPEDYKDESLRGKSAECELEIKNIKRLHLPEINQEFLSSLGCADKKELETWVKGTLESHLKDEIQNSKREQVYQYLLENTKLDLPERLSHRQSDRIAARRMLDLARQGVPEAAILKQADAIKTGAEKDAVNDLKLFFILEKIADDWKVEVVEDEINAQIAQIAQRQNRRFDRVRDDLIRTNNLSSLYVHVRDEKIIDQILEKAKIAEVSKKQSSEATKTEKADEDDADKQDKEAAKPKKKRPTKSSPKKDKKS